MKKGVILHVKELVKRLVLVDVNQVVAEDQAVLIPNHQEEVMAVGMEEAQVATIVLGDVKTVAARVAELHVPVVVETIVVANAKPVVLMIVLEHAKELV